MKQDPLLVFKCGCTCKTSEYTHKNQSADRHPRKECPVHHMPVEKRVGVCLRCGEEIIFEAGRLFPSYCKSCKKKALAEQSRINYKRKGRDRRTKTHPNPLLTFECGCQKFRNDILKNKKFNMILCPIHAKPVVKREGKCFACGETIVRFHSRGVFPSFCDDKCRRSYYISQESVIATVPERKYDCKYYLSCLNKKLQNNPSACIGCKLYMKDLLEIPISTANDTFSVHRIGM